MIRRIVARLFGFREDCEAGLVERIRALELGPDDMLVLSCDRDLSAPQTEMLTHLVGEAGIKNKVMALSRGMSLDVLRQTRP